MPIGQPLSGSKDRGRKLIASEPAARRGRGEEFAGGENGERDPVMGEWEFDGVERRSDLRAGIKSWQNPHAAPAGAGFFQEDAPTLYCEAVMFRHAFERRPGSL